jgi:hypothetical protein
LRIVRGRLVCCVRTVVPSRIERGADTHRPGSGGSNPRRPIPTGEWGSAAGPAPRSHAVRVGGSVRVFPSGSRCGPTPATHGPRGARSRPHEVQMRSYASSAAPTGRTGKSPRPTMCSLVRGQRSI